MADLAALLRCLRQSHELQLVGRGRQVRAAAAARNSSSLQLQPSNRAPATSDGGRKLEAWSWRAARHQVNSIIGTHRGRWLHGVVADVMNAAVRCWLPGLRRAPPI